MYRNIAVTVSTVVFLAGGLAVTGCEEPDEEAQQQHEQEDGQNDEQQDDEAGAEPDDDHAEEILEAMAEGAVTYFEGDQRWSTADGNEPWHDAAEADEMPGSYVAFDDKVFPGGAGVKLETAPHPPEDGEALPTEPKVLEGDEGVNIDDILTQLDVELGDEERFRYVYETGSETGTEATATLRAEANLDPDSSEHQTIFVQIEAEDDLVASYSHPYMEWEGH